MKFRGWGIRVPQDSRLPKAARVLRATSTRRIFPKEPDALLTIGHAVRDALDFREIDRWTNRARQRYLASDVARALRGSAGPHVGGDRRAHQFQTQLWWGAILEHGKLSPRVPDSPQTGKQVDFIINVTSMDYGVEIKRPSSRASLSSELRRARSQLESSGLKGIVIMDVTDCLAESDLFQVTTAPSGPPQAQIESAFRCIRDELGNRIFDSQRREVRPGFSPVFVLVLVARGFRWDLSRLRDPDSFLASWSGLFTSAKANLTWYHGNTIRDRIETGMSKAGIYVWQTTSET